MLVQNKKNGIKDFGEDNYNNGKFRILTKIKKEGILIAADIVKNAEFFCNDKED